MINIRHEKTNAWPGFVDLFSNLVIILIFLLIVFVFLWTTTSIFNKQSDAQKLSELEQENLQMTEDSKTAEELLLMARDALENQEAEKIQMEDTFEQQKEDIANAYEQHISELESQKNDIAKDYEQQIADLNAQKHELASKITDLTEQLQQVEGTTDELNRIETENSELISEKEELNTRLEEMTTEQENLNTKIAELTEELAKSKETVKQQEVEYTAMSNRLNKALADKVAELNTMSQYQSEFYREIKNALGDRTTVKQDGDRFIVSSDILFPSGSYKVSADGKSQLKILANVIKDFENKIPSNIDWIIRVDGHTDNKPVVSGTRGYKNNMQLSLLRATAVTNELVKNGVSKRRLVPSGFGELHPVILGSDAESLQKNRRIELQLTNK